MKKIVSALLIMCIVLTSCTPGNVDSGSTSSIPEPQPLVAPVAIETEHDTEYWWNNYIGDMVYLIQGAYPSVPASEQGIILEYCTTRYARDKGLDKNPSKETEATIPPEELAKYAKRYFGINDINRYYWDNTTKVGSDYSIYCAALMRDPTEAIMDEWYPFKLISAEKAEEVGVINLKLGVRALGESEQAMYPEGYVMFRNFEMVHSGNDEYYLRSVSETPIAAASGKTIEYGGEYTKLPLVNGQQPYTLSYSIVGGRIINLTEGPGTISLTSVDAKTGGDPRYLYPIFTKGDKLTFGGAVGDNFVIQTKDNFYVISPKLDIVTKQTLPDEVKSLYRLDFKGEQFELYYTVSPKLDQIAILDHQGAKVYDFTTKKLTTLAEYDQEKMDSQGWYNSGPTFSPDGEHIIVQENSEKSKLVVYKTSDLSKLEIPLPAQNTQTFYSMGTVFFVDQLNQAMTKGNHLITTYDLATGEKLGANKFRSELATSFHPMPDGRMFMHTTALTAGIRTHSHFVIEPVTGTVTDTGFKITTPKIISIDSFLVNGETAVIRIYDSAFGAESANISLDLPK